MFVNYGHSHSLHTRCPTLWSALHAALCSAAALSGSVERAYASCRDNKTSQQANKAQADRAPFKFVLPSADVS